MKKTNNTSELITLPQINILLEFSNFSAMNLKEYIEGTGIEKHYITRPDKSKIIAYKKSDIDKIRIK